jgi:ammonium transporter, Amt family
MGSPGLVSYVLAFLFLDVKITAGCATFQPWAAMIVGAVSGLLYPLSSDLLIRLKLDDVVDATPVHFVSGLWGTLSVGFLSDPTLTMKVTGTSGHGGFFYSLAEGHSDASLLACQVIGLIFVIGWTTFTMLPFFLGLHKLNWFRAESLEEIVGLDFVFNHGKKDGESDDHDEGMRDEYLIAYEEYKVKQIERLGPRRHGGSRSDARSLASGMSSEFMDT